MTTRDKSKLVPIEATPEMMDAGVEAAQAQKPDVHGKIGYVQIRAAWDAMVAAASFADGVSEDGK